MPEIEYPLEAEFNEANFGQKGEVFGPSSRSACRVLNSGSCGSGSIVGKRDGKTLVLTNAHVAGTQVGRVVVCQFPFNADKKYNGKVIMAGYSDKVMMDWAVIEIAEDVPLPTVKLSIQPPGQQLYSNGYPRCDGPWPVQLRTVGYTHNGTVWRGQPNAIGGQSGSAIHDVGDNLQRVLLTWSWGGDCAGQTTKAIWFQYQQRAVVGFERPEGLIELGDNRAEGLENGFFSEVNINTLPIWSHLDDTTPPPPPGDCKAFREAVLKQAEQLQQQVGKLIELARSAKPEVDEHGEPDPDEPNTGGTFGL